MASNEGTRETSEAYVVSTTPDVCNTPMGNAIVPVPYPIIGRFNQVERTSLDVRMTGNAVFTQYSRITVVTGDEAGTAGGMACGVNRGYCRAITYSTTVRTNGYYVVYNSAEMWMNCAGPEGPGNTTGKVVYVSVVSMCSVTEAGAIEGETNPDIELETEEEQAWYEKAWGKVKEVAQEHKLVERGLGVLQVAGAVSELAISAGLLLAPEPTMLTKVGGVALGLHGVDTGLAGLKQIWTGKYQDTVTQQAISGGAELMGADPGTADLIGSVGDMTIGILGPAGAARLLSRGSQSALSSVDNIVEASDNIVDDLGRTTDDVVEHGDDALKSADEGMEHTDDVVKSADDGASSSNAAEGSDGVKVSGDTSDASKNKADVLKENRRKGKLREEQVKNELEEEGHEVLGSQVTVKTPETHRRIDHLIQDGNTGEIRAIEVKSGNAVRSKSQIAKDTAMENHGGTIIGKNAPPELQGQTLPIKTEVRN